MSTVPSSSASPEATPRPAPDHTRETPPAEGHIRRSDHPWWRRYGAPILVLLLAAVILVTLTRNWNAWEGGTLSKSQMTPMYGVT